MTKLLSFWTAAFIAVFSSQAIAQTKFDLTNEYAFNSLIGIGNQYFADRVNAKSNGQIVVVPHFSGALGFKSKDVLDAVGRGAVQMGDAPVGFWTGLEPIFQLPVLPFVVSTTREAFVLYEVARPYYDKALLKNNQYLVYAAPWPPNGIWSKRPLDSTNAFKGLKIRTLDPASTTTFKALNAIPQQLAWADVIPMLASGGIEAVLTSADGGASAKFWDHVQHFSAVNFAWALSMLTVNKDAFDRLSDAQKKAFKEAAAETEAHQWAAVDERIQSSYAELRKHNVKVAETVPAEMQASMAEAAAPLLNEWINKVGPDAKTLVETFRKELSKR